MDKWIDGFMERSVKSTDEGKGERSLGFPTIHQTTNPLIHSFIHQSINPIIHFSRFRWLDRVQSREPARKKERQHI
jgi:hypothetical protein